jgi:hypothetical protein
LVQRRARDCAELARDKGFREAPASDNAGRSFLSCRGAVKIWREQRWEAGFAALSWTRYELFNAEDAENCRGDRGED